MIVIKCPYCNESRHEEELTFGGETDIVRPSRPDQATDSEWTSYLYFRANPKGAHQEQWCCSGGCGQWFKVLRDTVSHRVIDVTTFDGTFKMDNSK